MNNAPSPRPWGESQREGPAGVPERRTAIESDSEPSPTGLSAKRGAPLQLPLPLQPVAERDEAQILSIRLRRLLGEQLDSLVLTDNRSTFLSLRTVGNGRMLALRLHRAFADAPDHVLAMVATFCRSRQKKRRREALVVLRAFFDTVSSPREQRRRSEPLRSKGCYHDLGSIRDELNERYFTGRLQVAITWGGRPRAGYRRGRSKTIQLGSYCWEDNLIRIHPVLDDAEVPRLVVAAVVHHEMVHAAVPPRLEGGRHRVHTPEFRRREREFEHLVEADRWLEKSLGRLLRRRDAGG